MVEVKKFRIWLTFCNMGRDSDFQWHTDFLDNDGKGFTAEQARSYAEDLKRMDSIMIKNLVFEDLTSELFFKEV